MLQDFCDLVIFSWSSLVPSTLGPMSVLSFKLQRLKDNVKDWEKRTTLARTKEAKEIDSTILDLLSFRISRILTIDEATLLSQLKDRK